MKKLKIVAMTFLVLVIGGVLYYLSLTSRAGDLVGKYPVFNLKKGHYELVTKKPGHWVDLKNVSKEARFAIMLSEDWAFFDHDGYDLNQISIVLKESLEEKKLVRGASTITQQVVKNALLSNERSLIRKLKEFVIARELETKLSKNQILEMYLNLVELGKDLYGIKAASRFYFQKNPISLDAKEGAFLAMLLPSPRKYSQSFREKELTDFAKSQVNRILLKLQQVHIITGEEREAYQRNKLSFEYLEMPVDQEVEQAVEKEKELDFDSESEFEVNDDDFLKSKLKTNIKIDPIVK